VPKLNFLANMNISPLTVEQLRKMDWDIVRVPEIMSRKSKDKDILRYAREHKKVIITHDTDFSTLLAVGGYNKPSVINLRLENATPDFVTRRIIDVVSKLGKELEEGVVASVDEVYARYRELPIKVE